MTASPTRSYREPLVLLAVGAVLLLVSGIGPKDRLTWWLEVAPVLLGVPVLVATARRFRFTPLVYRLLFLHALILILGSHYTYAEVPLGEWAKAGLGFQRNNYDKVGHFAQGFIPALVVREVLLRLTPLRRGGWTSFLVVSVCLAMSAFYELVEWGASLLTGEAAEAFLGTQGYVWDTQSDMFLALIGSVLGLAAFTRVHDREMAAAGRRDV